MTNQDPRLPGIPNCQTWRPTWPRFPGRTWRNCERRSIKSVRCLLLQCDLLAAPMQKGFIKKTGEARLWTPLCCTLNPLSHAAVQGAGEQTRDRQRLKRRDGQRHLQVKQHRDAKGRIRQALTLTIYILVISLFTLLFWGWRQLQDLHLVAWQKLIKCKTHASMLNISSFYRNDRCCSLWYTIKPVLYVVKCRFFLLL